LSYLAAQPRTVEILGQQVYLCHRCDQPIFSISVLSSRRVVTFKRQRVAGFRAFVLVNDGGRDRV